jgi:potassium-transporting ATPase KdpC subunit
MREQVWTAIKTVIVTAILTGVLYPLTLFGIAQGFFPFQANGSLIRNRSGGVLGSLLIAQQFKRSDYFHPRASAAGSGYAADASSGTNLGPTSKKLLLGDKDFPGIKQLSDDYRQENGLSVADKIPPDAVTRSGSGLDPHISSENAKLQAPRIAKARNTPINVVMDLVDKSTEQPQLGFLGDSRVNVLKLNMALDAMKQ